MKTRKPTHNPAHMKDVPFPDEAEQRSLRTSWRGVTRRAILLATCAATASTLMFPSASFAAEWVNVDGTEYTAGAEAGTKGGSWYWDGADSMELNNYDGSGISAAGKLEITYSGENNVTVENYANGISVENGENEEADLTIKGDEDSSLTVEAEKDAIYSAGDVSISGEGTVTALSGIEDDAIHAESNVEIEGGTVVAKGGEFGIYAYDNVSIKNASVEASGDLGILSELSTTISGSELKASGISSGIYGYGGLTIDNSRVEASAIDGEDESFQSKRSYGIVTDEGDITIKNDSLVEAVVKNSGTAYGIYTYNWSNESGGGHITIADSTVTAKAETSAPDEYWAIGILAETSDSTTPASINISHSNVTAEGTSIAILSRNYALASTNPEFGAITIKDSTISTPKGSKLAKFEYNYEVEDEGESNRYVDRGMTIVSADTNTDEVIIDESLDDAVVNKVVITADEAEVEPTPEPEIKPAGYVTPTGNGDKKAIPQTGDASPAGLIASAIAGASALATGIFVTRKREG